MTTATGSHYSQDQFVSHAGLADNPSIGAEEIRHLERSLAHDSAQLAARRDGAFTSPAGLVLKFDPMRHYENLDDAALSVLVERGAPYGGIDFGSWRFAFLLGIADRIGRMHIVEEIFSQRETMDARALKIHTLLNRLGIRRISIWGDQANAQEIMELNAAFVRLDSPYRVIPVDYDNKIRAASVDRLNNLLARDALLIRRGLAARQVWRLGMNAGSDGQVTVGSRLTWEIGAWKYPEPKKAVRASDEKAQKQDPNDDSADGADAIAAARYMIMSWWKKAKLQAPPEESIHSRRVLKREAERGRRIAVRKVVTPKPGRRRLLNHPEFGEIV